MSRLRTWQNRRWSRTRGLLCAAAMAVVAGAAGGQSAPPLQLVQTIPLPGVSGRIDHLAVDVAGQRLFVAALGNNTVEVIDLRTESRVHSITGLHEPQGVAFVPRVNRLFVANGGTGALSVFDGTSFSLVNTSKVSGDADNLRYDDARQHLYVGYGEGSLGIINTKDGKRFGDISLAHHPESFQLETAGQRIFVNVPNANQIAVVDRSTGAVIATWPLREARANFPMALDEADQRLLVGFRKPAKLVVFDTESGKAVSDLAIAGDADDIFYDRARRRIYISGGEGFLDIIAQNDRDHYVRASQLTTAAGARTSLFVPEFDRVYLAVPRRDEHSAEIRVYAARS